MKRKRRTEILVHCNQGMVHAWAELCRKEADFHLLEEPGNALTMIKMRESAQNTLFYLGEMLVSETRVRCNDVIGIGLIQGDACEVSHDMAVIDAAFNASLDICNLLEKELLMEEERQRKEHQKQVSKILKTRVNFETMDV